MSAHRQARMDEAANQPFDWADWHARWDAAIDPINQGIERTERALDSLDRLLDNTFPKGGGASLTSARQE